MKAEAVAGDDLNGHGPPADVLVIPGGGVDAMVENTARMAGMPVGPLSLSDEVALDLGLKVAICDQIEDPKQAKGLVRRARRQVAHVDADTGSEAERTNNLMCRAVEAIKRLQQGVTGRVRLIGDEGEQVGIVTREQALGRAQEAGLDLVEEQLRIAAAGGGETRPAVRAVRPRSRRRGASDLRRQPRPSRARGRVTPGARARSRRPRPCRG